MDIMRQKLKGFKDTLVFGLSMLSPSNIRKQIRELKQKTYPELFVGFFKLFFYMFYYTGYFGVYLIKSVKTRNIFFCQETFA
jgi:ryanodine receptor 2